MDKFTDTSIDYYTKVGNKTFPQLFHFYPSTKDFFHKGEIYFNADPVIEFFNETLYSVPILFCVLYVLFLYFGTKYMKNKPAYELKYSLAAWNLFLAVFSTIGVLRTVPHFLWFLNNNGLYYTVCTDPASYFIHGACGYWVVLFVLSKIPELVDTVFIVLRKRPLLFLHYYHHVTVLLLSWHVYATQASYGLFFVVMNYFVHSIMYSYYFLAALKLIPRWFNPMCITLLQLAQMVVGTGVCLAGLYYKNSNAPCQFPNNNALFGLTIYCSYFALFFKFLINRFFRSKSNKTSPSTFKEKKIVRKLKAQ